MSREYYEESDERAVDTDGYKGHTWDKMTTCFQKLRKTPPKTDSNEIRVANPKAETFLIKSRAPNKTSSSQTSILTRFYQLPKLVRAVIRTDVGSERVLKSLKVDLNGLRITSRVSTSDTDKPDAKRDKWMLRYSGELKQQKKTNK